MLSLKTSVAAIVLAGSIGATAGITYVVTRTRATVSCPAAKTVGAPEQRPMLPAGAPIPTVRGQQF